MSKFKGAKNKVIRRLGNLPGLTCRTLNEVSKKHKNSLRKNSQYGIRLQTKQKIRYHYGITEKKLFRYLQQARKLKGSTGELLLELLEMRLDNVLFRSGFASTISSARQLINHGHILINGKKINIPSYSCQFKDEISINEKSESLVRSLLKESQVPSALSINKKDLKIKVFQNISHYDVGLELDELLVVEYYSRS